MNNLFQETQKEPARAPFGSSHNELTYLALGKSNKFSFTEGSR